MSGGDSCEGSHYLMKSPSARRFAATADDGNHPPFRRGSISFLFVPLMAAEWGLHMIKAIKLELFRMTHSVTLIVVFIVLLVANIFINGSEIPGVFNYYDVKIRGEVG